jgi:hypothetical protein
MGILFLRTFLILPLILLWSVGSVAKEGFSLADVRGESSACEETLKGQRPSGPLCHTPKPEAARILDQSALDIDAHLASKEIKREVVAMAESQVSLSLGLLQKLGIQNESPALKERLKKLEASGIKAERGAYSENPELLNKYLLASFRYYDLKRRENNFDMNESEKRKIQERVKLLELRYPLIAQHNFASLKDVAFAKFGKTRAFGVESGDESLQLDNFLFNDTPEKLADLDFPETSAKSFSAEALRGFKASSESLKNEIRDHLKDDLQNSLASQLKALSEIDRFGDCELLTLHSQSTQNAVNTSAEPERVFKKLCECRQQNPPVSDASVLGMGVASLGGLLLCMTPTGIGQVIGCPTAFVAGWGMTGASVVNFADTLGKYSNLNTQVNVMSALPANRANQTEWAFLKQKESELVKDMGTTQMVNLVGLGVGHVGFKGLTEVYAKSKVSGTFKKLSTPQQQSAEKMISSLAKEDQTTAFLLLNKLDAESRAILLAKPALFLKELKKGGRCGL